MRNPEVDDDDDGYEDEFDYERRPMVAWGGGVIGHKVVSRPVVSGRELK